MRTKLRPVFLMSHLKNTSQSEYPVTSTFENIEFKYLKKEIFWFWKTELIGRKTREKAEPEDKVLVLNPEEKKCNKKNGELF